MTGKLTDSRLASLGAVSLQEAFNAYRSEFEEITARAKVRFQKRQWQQMRTDASQRLDLYKKVVDRAESHIRDLLETRIHDKLVWTGIKAVYSTSISGRDDWELAETFFNSITRRIFATVGVDPNIEFVTTDFESPPTQAASQVFQTYQGFSSTQALIQNIFSRYSSMDTFEDMDHDASWVAGEIETHLERMGLQGGLDRAEMVDRVFYRGMGAYMVGRLYAGSVMVPLAIALLNTPDGIKADGVLLEEDKISILFSFTRSYFHVEVRRPYDLVQFLKSILPRKRISELYISTGFNKHGKTVLYRELLDHLEHAPHDRFEISKGVPGMVMIVFNMAQDDLVLKLIRDRFAMPKKVSRRNVVENYELVFRNDRAGRLVDAQAFEHLIFDQSRFSPELLDELTREAANTVIIEEGKVVIDFAYVERRVTPLNLYLEEADGEAVRRVIMDYGTAIKDLAVSNIFPGDILLKNFGVTRHGRVVFYDYDELCPLTSCNFRALPESSNYDDELSDEPWFYVGENDIFPEEFRRFTGLPKPLLDLFMEYHGDIFTVDFWQERQAAIEAGDFSHIFPYERNGQERRMVSPAEAGVEPLPE